jgi:histone H3/H4
METGFPPFMIPQKNFQMLVREIAQDILVENGVIKQLGIDSNFRWEHNAMMILQTMTEHILTGMFKVM